MQIKDGDLERGQGKQDQTANLTCRERATMPPKKAAATPSTSNALVPVGARHLSAKRQPKRDENGDKPTTARALILRNGKHGARGTGEMMLVTKLLGREKLDLLAGKDANARRQSVMLIIWL